MPDNDSRIEEIKQALEEATPGPWAYQKGGYARAHIVYEVETDNQVCTFSTHPKCEQNGHLIANAPEWLRYLLELGENLASEQAYAKREAIKWNEEAVRVREQYEQQQAEIRSLKVTSSVHEGTADSYARECERLREVIEGLQSENTHLRGISERERAIADSEVERRKVAEKECERLRIALHTHQSYDKTASELYEENERLQGELAEKDKVLEWYGDADNHHNSTFCRHCSGDRFDADKSEVELDYGSKARDTLSRYKEKGDNQYEQGG